MMDTNNRSLYVYTVSLLLVWLAVAATPTPAPTVVPPTVSTQPPTAKATTRFANPLLEHKHERNCKALCEHCGCLGFYCGEECICECNNDDSDTECIRTMQSNARQLDIPFEILIQGPSSNRFVRNAQQFEQKRKWTSKIPRNRRSTITIYKPTIKAGKPAAHAANALESTMSSKKELLELATTRLKRSVDHLEWFNDFASNLVRPAPFGAKQRLEAKTAAKPQKRSSIVDVKQPPRAPWFLEQPASRLTRPAPLSRASQRQAKRTPRRKVNELTESEEAKERARQMRPLREAMEVMESIPRVLQDTVSSLTSDSGDVFSLNIMNDNAKDKDNGRSQSKRRRQNSLDVRRKKTTQPPTTLAPALPLAPSFLQRGLFLPWWRQRQLKRFQRGLAKQ